MKTVVEFVIAHATLIARALLLLGVLYLMFSISYAVTYKTRVINGYCEYSPIGYDVCRVRSLGKM